MQNVGQNALYSFIARQSYICSIDILCFMGCYHVSVNHVYGISRSSKHSTSRPFGFTHRLDNIPLHLLKYIQIIDDNNISLSMNSSIYVYCVITCYIRDFSNDLAPPCSFSKLMRASDTSEFYAIHEQVQTLEARDYMLRQKNIAIYSHE